MKKVYICASFGSDPTESLAKAEWYTEYALRCGAAPIVPHFYGLYQKKAYTNTCAAAGQRLLAICAGRRPVLRFKTASRRCLNGHFFSRSVYC